MCKAQVAYHSDSMDTMKSYNQNKPCKLIGKMTQPIKLI